jgi:lysozyme family protein
MAKVEFSDALRKEYDLLFAQAVVRPENRPAVDSILARILDPAAQQRYAAVERQTGVPAHVVGIIHAMEASCRFDCHLHNGDPLTARTVQVPAGRPQTGQPPFAWVDSAVDALTLEQLDRWHDWSPAGIAYALEGYNGWGYRLFHPQVKSPYLWSFTTIYSAGKYVADGTWSDTAVSRQCGAMALLKRLAETGRIDLPAAAPAAAADEAARPTLDDRPPAAPPGAAPPAYPGRVLKNGSSGAAVAAVQSRLAALGISEVGGADGSYGDRTERSVRIFQARSVDESGAPLAIDGVVGPTTWAALFGAATVGPLPPARLPAEGSLAQAVLKVAAGEIGVREQPPGSNRGPRVDQYLSSVAPTLVGAPWCMAFVYFCFAQAAAAQGVANPAPRTASVWGSWNAAQAMPGARVVPGAEASADPTLIEPGMVFHIDTGGGTGHAGFVVDVVAGRLVTIEGNTNDGGSREGIGVFTRSSRPVASINLGFVAYA